MSEEIKPYKFVTSILPWLIPLLLSMMIGFSRIYMLLDRVSALEVSIKSGYSREHDKIINVDARVRRLEEFCCSEVDNNTPPLQVERVGR